MVKINDKESNKLVNNINIFTADISQELLLKFKISDRESHKIVSEAITYSESENKEFDINSLNYVLKSKGLNPLKIEEFNKLTNSNYILSRREEIGSANPCKISEYLKDINESIKFSLTRIFDKKTNLDYLFSEVENFLSS